MLLCQVNKLLWAFSDSCRDTMSIPALLLELVLLYRDKGRAELNPGKRRPLAWVAFFGMLFWGGLVGGFFCLFGFFHLGPG